MIPAIVVINLLMLSTDNQCIKHLNLQVAKAPHDSHVQKLNHTNTIIELYGAHLILRCEGKKYTASLLTEKPF